MSLHLFCLPVSLLVRDNVNGAIGYTSCQKKAVFPRTKLDCVYRSLCFIFVNTLPLIILHFFPEFYSLVITACCHNRLIFRVRPSNWPTRALMRHSTSNICISQLSIGLGYDLVSVHPANFDKTFTISSGQSCSIKIKLWVVLWDKLLELTFCYDILTIIPTCSVSRLKSPSL